jgi:hypothetical protein
VWSDCLPSVRTFLGLHGSFSSNSWFCVGRRGTGFIPRRLSTERKVSCRREGLGLGAVKEFVEGNSPCGVVTLCVLWPDAD